MDSYKAKWYNWENITPGTLGMVLLGWMYAKFGFDFYLCYRQYKVIKTNQAIPEVLRGSINPAVFERARNYRLDRMKLRMFSYIYNALLNTLYIEMGILFQLWTWSGSFLDFIRIWPSNWDHEIGQTIIGISIGIFVFNLAEMPLHLYFVFYIEEKHGFNRQTLSYFIMDQFMENILQMLFGSLVGALLVKTVHVGGQYFYVYLWIASYFVSIFLLFTYPTVIAPLFNKIQPLRDGRLRDRLTRLATICDFPLNDILIQKESKRSNHPGAYFYGLWNSKTIVIYDTLLIGHPEVDFDEDGDPVNPTAPVGVGEAKIYTEEEIVAIVCQKLGHWKEGHVLEKMILIIIDVNLIFLVFSFIYEKSILYEAFEFPKMSQKPIFIGLHIIFSYILDVWNFLVWTLFKYRTRHYEYNADKFVVRLGYGEDLKRAVIKLHKDNLNYPYFDPLYSCFVHDLPPELNRLEEINEEISKRN